MGRPCGSHVNYASHMRARSSGFGPTEQVRAALMARRFYVDRAPKTVIAREFGVSRFKVAEIIDRALEEGTIRIEVQLPAGIEPDLSADVTREYRLRHALVVDASSDDDDLMREQLGLAAARLLGEVVSEDDVLGIGWGRSIDAMADALDQLAPCDVVQMTGVVGSVTKNSVELVRRIAEISGGRAFPIYAPLFYEDARTRASIMRHEGIAAAIRRFSSVSVAVVAIGSWDPPESRVYEALPTVMQKRLHEIGGRAEICGLLIDDAGLPVATALNERTLAIPLEQLARVREIIAVAGGRRKVSAIRAALRGGHVTSLVTDAEVAKALLATTESD